MTGGILLALGGVWLGCQVFGGDALNRLGITGSGVAPATASGGGAVSPTTTPFVDNQTAQLTWTWLKTISTMNMPSDGLVQMFTSKMLGAGTPLMSWVLQGAFPVSWEIDAFDAGASKVAMENLTIIHEGFLMDETKLSAGSI